MKAWEDFLCLAERDLGSQAVKKWLRPLVIVRYDACNLYLEAKDSFQIPWFEEHIRPLVATKLTSKSNKRIKVHLTIASNKTKPEALPEKKRDETIQKPPALPVFELLFDVVDPHLSYKNFIVTEGSLVTYKLLSELTGYNPKTHKLEDQKIPFGTFNPIYIHGPSGSGKTHLLMATYNYLRAKGLKALYTKAETFTEHVVGAIRASEMQQFRSAYRNIDALLIDDVEVFSRKGATQEELFHTFNTLHLEGKQIIISSKSTPQELASIEPRLISRFEWGIVLPLQPLKHDEISELLLSHAAAFNFPLSEKVKEFLLQTFTSNTKALLQALDALVLRSHLHQADGRGYALPLTLDATKHLLLDLMKVEERSILTPEKIIKTVAESHGIRIDDILGKAQSRDCAFPRQIAMYLCRKELNLPFMKIGDLFSRDHSTVMSSVRQVEKTIDNNPEIAQTINGILKQLKS